MPEAATELGTDRIVTHWPNIKYKLHGIDSSDCEEVAVWVLTANSVIGKHHLGITDTAH